MTRVGHVRDLLRRLSANYGMAGVLVLLCLYYAWATLQEQTPQGEAAARLLCRRIATAVGAPAPVLIVGRQTAEDDRFVAALAQRLQAAGYGICGRIQGEPRDARRALEALAAQGAAVAVIATVPECATWQVFADLPTKLPALGRPQVLCAPPYRWPTFLKTENLLNVASQIAVVAVIAIGMTLVIVTGGIDLSVGSLVALGAVVTGTLIRDHGGGAHASTAALVLCSLAGIAACGVMGAISGLLVTLFRLPSFIATLGLMQVASGLAYILSRGNSIYEIPDAYVWLGRGFGWFGIPHAVILMAVLYLAAHIVMSRSVFGRYIYAVGGNAEAARLSGVRVGLVLLVVYTLSGVMAGLGGIVLASQLKSAAPTYGQMYELYVIAAVVVGGTSLSGGEGRIFGTLIGAFIIAVIQNGMNLTGVESYTQKVVLGLVILGAVLLDNVKKRGLRWPPRLWPWIGKDRSKAEAREAKAS